MTELVTAPEPENDSKDFWNEFWQKCRLKNKPMRFRLYFVVAILLFGMIGTFFAVANLIIRGWGTDYINLMSVFQNLTTYAIAIAATSFVDFVISEKEQRNDAEINPLHNNFSLLLIVGFFLVIASTFWTYFPTNKIWSSFGVLFGTGVALLVWWIANAENSKLLQTQPRSNAAMGGEVETIAGDKEVLNDGIK